MRTSRSPLRILVLIVGLIASVAVPAGAVDLQSALLSARADAIGEQEAFQAANITFHDNDRHRVGSLDGEELLGGGSDIEFATVSVEGTDVPLALAGTIDLPADNGGLQIYDLSDEADPTLIAVWDCRVSQGDIQVFTREVDGTARTFVAYGADYSVDRESTCVKDAEAMGLTMGNAQGAYFADITDPYNPVTVGFVNIGTGSHNTTVHPSGDYLYNSANGIGASIGQLDYVDISDLGAPVKLGRLNLETGIENHDITFSADGDRAYVAAINQSLILDTTDPAAPTILSRIVNPMATIHHQADPVTLTHPVLGERTYLVITDEFGGAAGNAVCPGGGLIIYDITGELELAPVQVGAWFIPQTEVSQGDGRGSLGILPACTSHVLRFHPEAGIMTIGWYSAGVRVVDISNLIGASVGVVPGLGDTGSLTGQGMAEIGFFTFDDSNSWSAKTPQVREDGSFMLYSNDLQRGLDTFEFAGVDERVPTDPGTWMTPQEWASFKAPINAALDRTGDRYQGSWCMLRAAEESLQQ